MWTEIGVRLVRKSKQSWNLHQSSCLDDKYREGQLLAFAHVSEESLAGVIRCFASFELEYRWLLPSSELA